MSLPVLLNPYMSRKVDIFRLAIPHPLTQKDVTVICPRILQMAIVGQSSTFPTEELQGVTIPVRGQEVELPTRFKVNSDWSFTVPDSTFTQVRLNLMTVMYKKVLFDVYLLLGDYGSVLNTNNLSASLVSLLGASFSALSTAQTLCRCWIRRIEPVQFSADTPDKPVLWSVTVHYNYIKALKGII